MSTRLGLIEQFDERRGIGVVTGDDGERHGFHCTAVADGSRSIEVGTRVVYEMRTGPLGRDEASAISPV